MLSFSQRISNLEGKVAYLLNNSDIPTDDELTAAREEIFDEINELIKELSDIRSHTELVEDTIRTLYKDRNTNNWRKFKWAVVHTVNQPIN